MMLPDFVLDRSHAALVAMDGISAWQKLPILAATSDEDGEKLKVVKTMTRLCMVQIDGLIRFLDLWYSNYY
jgi:hypothetical protein